MKKDRHYCDGGCRFKYVFTDSDGDRAYFCVKCSRCCLNLDKDSSKDYIVIDNEEI